MVCLRLDLEFPDYDDPIIEMSEHMRQTIDKLLTLDPEERSNGFDLREMQLFKSIKWDNLLSTKPPFIPEPENPRDTSYFVGKLK